MQLMQVHSFPIKVDIRPINNSPGVYIWSLENKVINELSFIILRNNYYVGNDFWGVYLSNPEIFNYNLLTDDVINQDGQKIRGFRHNFAPIRFRRSNEYIMASVFTLSGNGTLEFAESFPNNITPVFQGLFKVTKDVKKEFILNSNRDTETLFNLHAGIYLQDKFREPKSVQALEMVTENINAPPVSAFDDKVEEASLAGKDENIRREMIAITKYEKI